MTATSSRDTSAQRPGPGATSAINGLRQPRPSRVRSHPGGGDRSPGRPQPAGVASRGSSPRFSPTLQPDPLQSARGVEEAPPKTHPEPARSRPGSRGAGAAGTLPGSEARQVTQRTPAGEQQSLPAPCTRTHMCTHTHGSTRPRPHARGHTRKHTHAHPWAHGCTHMYTLTDACTHMHVHTHPRAHIHTGTHSWSLKHRGPPSLARVP